MSTATVRTEYAHVVCTPGAETLAAERVLLTNDQDFLALAAEAATRQARFAPIFYWPQQQRRVSELVSKIIQEASQASYSDACSRIFFF